MDARDASCWGVKAAAVPARRDKIAAVFMVLFQVTQWLGMLMGVVREVSKHLKNRKPSSSQSFDTTKCAFSPLFPRDLNPWYFNQTTISVKVMFNPFVNVAIFCVTESLGLLRHLRQPDAKQYKRHVLQSEVLCRPGSSHKIKSKTSLWYSRREIQLVYVHSIQVFR